MNQDNFLNESFHTYNIDLSVSEVRRSSSSTPTPRINGGVTGGGLINFKSPLFPLIVFNLNVLKGYDLFKILKENM